MKKISILLLVLGLIGGFLIGLLIGKTIKNDEQNNNQTEFYYCKIERNNLTYPVWVKTENGESPEFYAAEKTYEIHKFMPHDFMITCEKTESEY